jgi:hypothetical protein
MTFDAKDVQDAVKALAEAVGPKNDWLEALKTLAWPVVVALALWGFARRCRASSQRSASG